MLQYYGCRPPVTCIGCPTHSYGAQSFLWSAVGTTSWPHAGGRGRAHGGGRCEAQGGALGLMNEQGAMLGTSGKPLYRPRLKTKSRVM